MLARILVITDLHKRYQDSVSIKGQVEASRLVQQDLIEFNLSHGVTHNIICGDWYHRGFNDLGKAFGAIQEDRNLSKSVNGNVYLTIGNHFYLERDFNPEMYVIQPNEKYRPNSIITMPKEPIFKCQDTLRIGNVQFSFFHYNKVNKNYIADVEPGVTTHIGIYHDDCVVPGWVREQEGFLAGNVSLGYMTNIFNNIDLAISGHIHTAIGLAKMTLADSRVVPMLIPGALCVTQNKPNQKHEFVQLPLIEIEDDSKVNLKQVKFSTHMERMIFRETQHKDIDNPLNSVSKISAQSLSAQNLESLPIYLRARGYDDMSIGIIRAASHTSMNVSTLLELMNSEVSKNVEYTGVNTAS